MIVPSSRPDPSQSDRERRLDEAIAEYLLAAEAGRAPERRAFLARYPDLADDLAAFFEDEDCVRGLAGTVPMSGEEPRGRSPLQAAGGAEHDAEPGVGGELGDFVLLEEIAAGGMGVVFKARQKSLNRVVALKTIRPSAFRPGDDAAARFRIEAEAVARLDHPGIVPIFEMGELAGYPYLCLKLIDGGDLDRHLGRFRNDPAASARLMVEVARAVHYAHQRGILHRDLKPSNILLDGQGRPHVTDFGLARCLEDDSRITQTGLILGTPSYMAPEQVAGRRSEVTTAADVYGLGAVLYTLLAGRPPFKADSVYETLRQVREQEPASPRTFSPQVDRDLEAICLKCLEKDPRGRYPSAAAMAVDLDHWLDGEPIAARPSGRAERAWRWYRRNRLVANISVGVACLIVAFAVIAGISAVGYSQSAARERVQRELAQAREGDIRRRLVQLAVGRGIKVMDEGDSTGALPWFAEAMVFDSDDPQAEATHRMRLGTLITQCPSLDALFTHAGPINWATLDRSGRLVASASADGTARAWDAATGGAATPPLKHDGAVNRAEFRGDGRRLVTASDDGFVRIWDVDAGRTEASAAPALRLAHGSPVKIAMFSPDGRRVISGGFDGTIRIWDATDGLPIGGAYRVRPPLFDLAQSPDGSRLATGGAAEGGTRLWRVEGSRLNQPIVLSHRDSVREVAFSPDGTMLATACMDGTARVWDARTGEPVTAPIAHGRWLAHAEFSPDGSRLVTGSEDGTARVWDARTGRPMGTAVASMHHASGVNEVSFSPDGSRLVTAGNDGTARVWDAATGAPLSSPLYHGTSLRRARFTPDGYRVLTVGSDPTARLWDVTGVGAPAVTVEGTGGMNYACFDPSGRWIGTAGNDGVARVWDARNGEAVSPPLRHRGGVLRVAFAPDSRLVATAGGDGLARVWDAAGGWSATCTLEHARTVLDVRFSPDGARLATASADGAARIWDAATGRAIVPRLEHGQKVLGLTFSPDGRYLATAGADGTARVWDAETGRAALAPLEHDAPVTCVAFSPDGRTLLTACSDQTLAVLQARQWDLTTGRPLGVALRHGDGVLWAAYSPDGRRIATASEDRTARVWDAATGEPLTRPLTHQHQVFMVEFSPDSRRLATCSADGTARVWDAATGEPVSPSLSHRDRVKVGSVSFSPDGRGLLTAGQDGTARIWELPRDNRPSDILFLHAKVLAGRRIDQTEAELPLDAAELAESWDRLRGSGPVPRARPPGSRAEALSRIAWHRREVRRLDQSHQALAISWHLERLRALVPGDPSVDGRLAAVYEVTGDWGRLVRLASRAIAAGSDDVEVRTRRGWARFHLTHADDAAVDFRQALKQDPKSATARLGLFTALAALGRRSEAESIWASLIDNQDEWRQDRLAATSAHLRRLGNDNSDGWWFWRARGLVQIQTGHPDQAESDYGRAIQIKPDDVWSYMGRGVARKKLGRPDDALADLARAIEIEPRLAVAWRCRGEIHGARGEWDAAARDFARWADLGGEPVALFWYDHSALRLHTRDRGDYRRTCMNIWECFGRTDDMTAAGYVARACVLGPDPGVPADQVVELARRVARGNSRNSWSLSTLGAALYRAGKFDEAIARLDEAKEVDPGWSGAPLIELFRSLAVRARSRGTPRGGRDPKAARPDEDSPVNASKLFDRMKRAKAPWNFGLEAELLVREHNEGLSGAQANRGP